MISMGKAFTNFWKNYFNFTGTATRAEYWWMILWEFIIIIGWGVLSSLIFYSIGMNVNFASLGDLFVNIAGGVLVWAVITVIGVLAFLIPELSLHVRRFRDTGLNNVTVWIFFILWIVAYYFTSPNYSSSFMLFFSRLLIILAFILTVLPTDILSNVKLIGRNNN